MADMLDGFRDIYEDFYGMTDEKERKKAINDRIKAAEGKSRSSSAGAIAPALNNGPAVVTEVVST